MHKQDEQKDLNHCTTRQLTSVPGVDKKLAEAIVRHRQSRGRLTHIEDLWQVPGLTRPKFLLLRRHFKVIKEKPVPISNRKLPPARVLLTESVVNFLCQGYQKDGHRSQAASAYHKQEADDVCSSQHSKSGVSITKNSIQQFGKHTVASAHKRINKQDTSTKNDFQNGKRITIQTFPSNLDILQTFQPARNRQAWSSNTKLNNTESTKQVVTFQTTPSGDNMCTAESKLLNAPSAQSPTKSVPGQPEKSDARSADQENNIDHDNDLLDNAHNYLPVLGMSEQYGSFLKMGSSSSTSSRLSLENMLLFERNNTLDERRKKKLIESWICNVNEACRVNRLLHGRERVESQPVPFSKSGADCQKCSEMRNKTSTSRNESDRMDKCSSSNPNSTNITKKGIPQNSPTSANSNAPAVQNSKECCSTHDDGSKNVIISSKAEGKAQRVSIYASRIRHRLSKNVFDDLGESNNKEFKSHRDARSASVKRYSVDKCCTTVSRVVSNKGTTYFVPATQ